MKAFALLALLAVAIPAGIALADDTSEAKPYVHRMVFAGKGIGIPPDGDLDNIRWIDKIAVGSIKKASHIKRAGIMKVTDSNGQHKYRIRNITVSDGEVSALIFDRNKTQVGSISVSFKVISGKEAWSGSLVLAGWSGNVIIGGHKVKIRPSVRERLIKEEREMGDCDDDRDCELKHHFRHIKDDIRSREFIKEKCLEPEYREKCRVIIENRKKPEIAARALEILPLGTLRNLSVRSELLINNTRLKKIIPAKRISAIKKKIRHLRNFSIRRSELINETRKGTEVSGTPGNLSRRSEVMNISL
jgi:hypothetical protein